MLDRRSLLKSGVLGGAAAAISRNASAAPQPSAAQPPTSELDELTVADLQKRTRVGRGLRAHARRKVHGEDRGGRPPGADAPGGPRGQPRRPGDRRPTRRGAQGRQGPRSAPRDPRPDQGQHRDRRPHADDGRLARARRRGSRDGRPHRPAAARRGRGDPRQDEPLRVGELPLDALLERLERPRRAVPQPVRARPRSVGLELRLGGRGGGEPLRRSPSARRPTARSSRRPTTAASSA